MTDLSRRGFFKLVAGSAALVSVSGPIGSALLSVETIYCDGVHDDAPGLNALLRGEIVRFVQPELAEGIGWSGDTLHMNGSFTVRQPIEIEARERDTFFAGGEYLHEHDGPMLIVLSASKPGRIEVRNQYHSRDNPCQYSDGEKTIGVYVVSHGMPLPAPPTIAAEPDEAS